MPYADRITVAHAVQEKGISRQGVDYAIRAGHINIDSLFGVRVIVVDNKYKSWTPNLNRRDGQLKRFEEEK